MIRVTRSTTVTATPEAVVGYLQDFGHAEEWDPGTRSCTRLDDGPVRVGSRWRNVSSVLGRETTVEYTLVELRADGVVFEGRNAGARTVDDIRVAPAAGEDTTGSVVDYHATVELRGWSRLAYPLMHLAFRRLADKTVEQLRRTLDGLRT